MKFKIKLKPHKEELEFPCLMAYIGPSNTNGVDTVVKFHSLNKGFCVVRCNTMLATPEWNEDLIDAEDHSSWQPCNIVLLHKQGGNP